MHEGKVEAVDELGKFLADIGHGNSTFVIGDKDDTFAKATEEAINPHAEHAVAYWARWQNLNQKGCQIRLYDPSTRTISEFTLSMSGFELTFHRVVYRGGALLEVTICKDGRVLLTDYYSIPRLREVLEI